MRQRTLTFIGRSESFFYGGQSFVASGFESGEPLVHSGKPLAQSAKTLVHSGKPLAQSAKTLVKSGNPLNRASRLPIVRSEPFVYSCCQILRCGESLTQTGNAVNKIETG